MKKLRIKINFRFHVNFITVNINQKMTWIIGFFRNGKKNRIIKKKWQIFRQLKTPYNLNPLAYYEGIYKSKRS